MFLEQKYNNDKILFADVLHSAFNDFSLLIQCLEGHRANVFVGGPVEYLAKLLMIMEKYADKIKGKKVKQIFPINNYDRIY